MEDDEGSTRESLQLLCSMGFPEESARSSLQMNNGNVERSIETLLSGVDFTNNENDGSSTHSPQRTQSNSQYIHCHVSQYSSPSGRSACTYISLTAALQMLDTLKKSSPKKLSEILTPTIIESFVNTGIEYYNCEKTSSAIEHSSPEEVLSSLTQLSPLKLIGGVRQGVLSAPHLSFSQIITSCHSDADPNCWMAVVITKTPETVVIFLPPRVQTSGSSEFALFDSHPRPECGCQGSYTVIYNDFDSLVMHLETLFPVVDLGPGVGETMVMMYNSFDVYALQL